MSQLFKEAVCWMFHGETVESIIEDLKFTGDIDEVKKVSNDLKNQGYDYDDVYAWSKT